jgi:hypothetical protein
MLSLYADPSNVLYTYTIPHDPGSRVHEAIDGLQRMESDTIFASTLANTLNPFLLSYHKIPNSGGPRSIIQCRPIGDVGFWCEENEGAQYCSLGSA